MRNLIVLDYRDKRPLYEQVEEKLINLIAAGVLPEDEKIPSVRSLAMELSINPNTVQRAYRELESEGFIYTVQGRGNFVAKNTAWQDNKQKEVIEEIKPLLKKAVYFGAGKRTLINLVEDACKGDDRND